MGMLIEGEGHLICKIILQFFFFLFLKFYLVHSSVSTTQICRAYYVMSACLVIARNDSLLQAFSLSRIIDLSYRDILHQS